MAVTYTYPESAELTRISPDLILAATMDDPIFRLAFPIKDRNAAKVRWKIKDNYRGLMALRGLGGEPSRVNRVGDKEYEAEPGAYGEFISLGETEMTNRAAGIPDNLNIPISVDDLVTDAQEQLTVRQVQRMRMLSWLYLLTGTYAIPLPLGGIGHTDTYTVQTYAPGVLWSTLATSVPLADFRALQATFGLGTSNKFGAGATALMNTITKNYLLSNTNANDIGGKRVENGANINDVPTINRILAAQDVPQIEVFDDGYLDESGTFQLYIPTGKVAVIGQRPAGEMPGEFQMTRNMNNPGAKPGPYAFVDDRTTGPTKTVPPRVDTHQGFNGGPVMERPTQVVIMTVA